MKISFTVRILSWMALLVLPLLAITLLGPGLVKHHTSSRIETSLADVRSVHYHGITKALTGHVVAASQLASDDNLLALMDKQSQFRLRKLDNPMLEAPVPGIPTVDLSTPQPLQDFVVMINDRRPAASSGVLAMQLLATDASVLGESPGFRWQPDTPTAIFTAMKSPDVTIGPVYTIAGEQRIPVITPVRGERRELLGALVTEFNLAPVVRSVDEHKMAAGDTHSTLIRGVNGKVTVLAPQNAMAPGTSIALSALGAKTGTIEQHASDDGKTNTAYASIAIPNTDWGLVVSGNTNDQAELHSSLRNMTLAGLGLTFLVLAGGWLLVLRPFDKRLRNIAKATEKMVKRDYRIRLDDPVDDKAGAISRHLDQIAGEFNEGVSVRIAVEEHLQNAADRDELTGVYNQAYIAESLEKFSNNPALLPVTIACLRLRGYEDVKVNHGAAAAEEILVATAERLQSALDHQFTIARRRGNEFVILASNTDSSAAIKLSNEINSVFTTSFETSAGELLIGCESGLATAESVLSLDQTFGEAEMHMDNASQTDSQGKPSAKDCVRLVESAVKGKRLDTWYQPIVKLSDGKAPELVGAETFMRIYDEQGELIPPSLFMQEIQEFPIGQLLDQLVLKQALDTLHHWHQNGGLPARFLLSVNVSRHTIRSTKIVKFLASELEALQLSPSSIALEISGGTQTINVDVLADLQALGITLSMDDVGLKYSNIEQLLSIEPTFVKIDQRRLQADDADPKNGDTQARLNTLLQTMGMEIIAKSVESAEQIEELVDHGITLFQGFLFDQPRDAAAFIEKWGSDSDPGQEDLRKAG